MSQVQQDFYSGICYYMSSEGRRYKEVFLPDLKLCFNELGYKFSADQPSYYVKNNSNKFVCLTTESTAVTVTAAFLKQKVSRLALSEFFENITL